MSVVFYPAMGIDIVTPLLCIKDVNKIIATGPIPHKRFGKGALEKTMDFICNIVKTGNNEFYEGRDVDDDHFIEFLVDEGVLLKRYNFKTKGMYLLQFRYAERPVSIFYYYNIDPKEKWPFNDHFDYVIHRDYSINIQSPKCKFMTQLRPLLKPNTQLIATKNELRGQWGISKQTSDSLTPIESYQFIVEQTKYRSEGQFQPVFIVNIHNLSSNENPTTIQPNSLNQPSFSSQPSSLTNSTPSTNSPPSTNSIPSTNSVHPNIITDFADCAL